LASQHTTRFLITQRFFFRAVAAAGGLLSLAATLVFTTPGESRAQTEIEGAVLAVVGRQAAFLNLEAPRHRMLSRIATPANAIEVTALPDGSGGVLAVNGPYPGGGLRGSGLVHLDLSTGDTQPLLQRAEPRESLNMPGWWSDRQTLIFERQDLGGQPVGAPGQEVPRYPSRIERVLADGTERAILIADGRQPDAAPDGSSLVYARTTNQGASLLVWRQVDGSVETLVPEGRFADVAYPRFSPDSHKIAFVAPQSGVLADSPTFLESLFGPSVAYAHGIPWDPWIVNVDGTDLHRVAETGADEPSVSWSPDGSRLFVYSGTGSFIVEAATGNVTALQFVQGFGPTAWLSVAP
jgi:dipeptidyl aminopeptidase/acylaminoacyl peptidase